LHVQRIAIVRIHHCGPGKVQSSVVESILAQERQTEAMLKQVAFAFGEHWWIRVGKQFFINGGGDGRVVVGQRGPRLLATLFTTLFLSPIRLAPNALVEISHDFLAVWRRRERLRRFRVLVGRGEVARREGSLGRVHGCQEDEIGGDLSGLLERLLSFAVPSECEESRAFVESDRAWRGWRRAGPCHGKGGKSFLVTTGAKVRESEHEVGGSPAGRKGDGLAGCLSRLVEIPGRQQRTGIVKAICGRLSGLRARKFACQQDDKTHKQGSGSAAGHYPSILHDGEAAR